MKKLIAVVLVLAVAAAAGVGGFVWYRSKNASSVDTWIGKQVVGIVSSNLEPVIDFKSVTYTAPYLVQLRDATLTSRDGTEVTRIGSLDLELAELPQSGQPIKIKKVAISNAQVELIEKPEGGFKGLVPFVRGKQDREKADESARLSSVLRLEKVEIRDLSLKYAPADGSPAMILPGLALDLNVTKSAGKTEPGWYDLDTKFGRAPGLTADVKGAVNIDTFITELARCDLAMSVDPQTLQSLPPQLQNILRTYEAKGALTANVTGTLPLLKALDGDVTAGVNLKDFNVSVGEYKFPIQTGTIALKLKSGVANLNTFDLRMLDGAILADGRIGLGETGKPAKVNWKVEKINIRELLRAGAEQGETPKFAGIVNASGVVATSLEDPKGKLSGDGVIALKDGRVATIPGLKELADAMKIATAWVSSSELTHKVDAKFSLGPTGITVNESEVVTEFLAARATGLVGFDQTMDMRVNAGPMEKVQNLLGDVGKIIGQVTDKFLKYRVHGPTKSPKVEILPLGLGG